jgi:hypothetical protein
MSAQDPSLVGSRGVGTRAERARETTWNRAAAIWAPSRADLTGRRSPVQVNAASPQVDERIDTNPTRDSYLSLHTTFVITRKGGIKSP